MKKLSIFFICIILIFAFGCAASYHEVKKSEIPLKNYSKITLMPINNDKFWEQHPELKSDEKWLYQVNRASEHIEKKVNDYFKEKMGSEGNKELKMQAELFEFNPGSRAARYWVGFGAGKGKIGYHVKLYDGESNNQIAEFDAYGTISMGAFGGDIGVAYDQCANAIIEYIEINCK